MKRVAIGAWRLVTFLVGSIVGWPPEWLADKMEEENRRNRLV